MSGLLSGQTIRIFWIFTILWIFIDFNKKNIFLLNYELLVQFRRRRRYDSFPQILGSRSLTASRYGSNLIFRFPVSDGNHPVNFCSAFPIRFWHGLYHFVDVSDTLHFHTVSAHFLSQQPVMDHFISPESRHIFSHGDPLWIKIKFFLDNK